MIYQTELVDQVLVVRLEGNLIGGLSAQALLKEANERIGTGTRLCAVDISEVHYLNSAGIDVLITLLTRFRNKGGELLVVNPTGQVRKRQAIAKLNAIFQPTESRENAIEKLKSSVTNDQ